MCRWRNRLLLALIIYFAGFATAIYVLAPAPGNQEQASRKTGAREKPDRAAANIISPEFAAKAGSEMQRFLGFAEEKAAQAGTLIKARLNELKKNKSEK